MISAYIREQQRYSLNDLCNALQCPSEKAVPLIRRMKEFGILKAVKTADVQKDMSELSDDDVQVADVSINDSDYYYVFTFVGVIIIAGRVLKCYPKYITAKAPLRQLKQVLKVLDKYNQSEEQIVNIYNGDAENRSFNMLAVILYLLRDYFAYGLYNNTEPVTEINGEGQILWERTISSSFPLIRYGRPYYVELQTVRSANNENDFFHRLHAAIISECSEQLEEAQLNDLFDLEFVEPADERPSDLGEPDFLLNRIESELSITFNTRKQVLLKTMYAYISENRKMLERSSGISLYGSNSFNLVWEKACASVFDNKLQTQLKSLYLPNGIPKGYNPRTRLIDIIEKPRWTAADESYSHYAADTLIPDIVTFSGRSFIILDAKYYKLVMNKDILSGQPGIESITKQYLYQLAYKDFIQKSGFNKVKNCFVFPSEDSEVEDRGSAELKMMSSLGLENIEIRMVPAETVYANYLSEMKIPTSYLKL